MGRIAFYAPLKPPTHAVPSGDREMARNLMAALDDGTHRIELVSELRSRDATGDAMRQSNLRQQALAEVGRIHRKLSDGETRAWVTYHNYYKAPDLLGPAICAQLDLPYIQIESTRAKSRLTGPWAGFARAAEAATDAADLVYYLTEHDRLTLDRDRPDHQRLAHLCPFLPVADLPAAADPASPRLPMLSAGMMRAGDKLASYALIAATLTRLATPDWRLDIAGDGPARPQVQALMAPFGDRVRFLGQLDHEELQTAYRHAALFLWPGVNEAFGMVYLEAQAAGLPVVAQDRPGVRDVIGADRLPAPQNGATELARHVDRLLADPALRARHGNAGRAWIAENALIGTARETLWLHIAPLIGAGR